MASLSITPTLPSEADYAQALRVASEDAASSAMLAHLGWFDSFLDCKMFIFLLLTRPMTNPVPLRDF